VVKVWVWRLEGVSVNFSSLREAKGNRVSKMKDVDDQQCFRDEGQWGERGLLMEISQDRNPAVPPASPSHVIPECIGRAHRAGKGRTRPRGTQETKQAKHERECFSSPHRGLQAGSWSNWSSTRFGLPGPKPKTSSSSSNHWPGTGPRKDLIQLGSKPTV
jgi:hypothetical protein